MLNSPEFRTLFAYHWHTTRLLAARAAELDEAAYRASPGAGQRSVHELLFHLLSVDWSWRIGFDTGKQPQPPSPEKFPDLAALQAAFDREQMAWDALLGQLSPERISQDLELTSLQGYRMTMPCWRVLQHVLFHGMQHHAELAQLLTSYGHSPGDIDLLFFREPTAS